MQFGWTQTVDSFNGTEKLASDGHRQIKSKAFNPGDDVEVEVSFSEEGRSFGQELTSCQRRARLCERPQAGGRGMVEISIKLALRGIAAFYSKAAGRSDFCRVRGQGGGSFGFQIPRFFQAKGGRVKVHLTRCGQVSKAKGSPAGKAGGVALGEKPEMFSLSPLLSVGRGGAAVGQRGDPASAARLCPGTESAWPLLLLLCAWPPRSPLDPASLRSPQKPEKPEKRKSSQAKRALLDPEKEAEKPQREGFRL